MNGVKLSRGDTVVWLLAATLLVGLYMMFWQADGHGAEAVVLVNGKRWARLDLFQNQDLDVQGHWAIVISRYVMVRYAS